MPTGLRFNPPAIELTPEIHWVLLRSVGPLDKSPTRGFDSASAVDFAGRLTVGARIAARMGRDALVSEIDAEADGLLAERIRAMATEIAHDRTLERCAEIGASTGIPIVILKGHALRVTGRLVSGGRRSADVDLLVAQDRAAEYHAALKEQGFDPGDFEGAGTEHHLAGLADPEGGVVEVHTKLLGVTVNRKGSVGWMELKREGWLESLPEVGEGCFVPSRRVLAAHALAHGIAQHGRRPASYPLLWMMGDLIDLGVAGPSDGVAEDEEAALCELLSESVSKEEVEATLELAGALERGEVEGNPAGLSPGARGMLDHILASQLDEAYQSQAPLRVFHGRLSDKSRARVVMEDLSAAAFPSRETLEQVYGNSPGPVGRVGQRVRWVASRVGRLVRALVARG